MPRVILLILLIYALYWLGQRFLRSIQQKNKTTGTKNKKAEKMIQCERCKTHIPESEAVQMNNQLVCKNQPCQK